MKWPFGTKKTDPSCSLENQGETGERSFFPVEWAKSREARIGSAFGSIEGGVKYVGDILRNTYGLLCAKREQPMTTTEEVLTKANLSQKLCCERHDLTALYPHPEREGCILAESKNGQYYEIDQAGNMEQKVVHANSRLLDFWQADDDVLFETESDSTFHV